MRTRDYNSGCPYCDAVTPVYHDYEEKNPTGICIWCSREYGIRKDDRLFRIKEEFTPPLSA
jgi:thiol-disulfide isomerase/thioredoxin